MDLQIQLTSNESVQHHQLTSNSIHQQIAVANNNTGSVQHHMTTVEAVQQHHLTTEEAIHHQHMTSTEDIQQQQQIQTYSNSELHQIQNEQQQQHLETLTTVAPQGTIDVVGGNQLVATENTQHVTSDGINETDHQSGQQTIILISQNNDGGDLQQM